MFPGSTINMARNNMGTLNPALANAGYQEDDRGNVYYPDGTIMYGPDVFALSRPRTLNSPISIFTQNPSPLTS